MKYLQDYIQDAQTECFDKHKAFFAFSNAQLNEGLKRFDARDKADDYVGVGAGLCCHNDNAQALLDELDSISQVGIKKDIEENTIEGVILRELSNHEAYYTGDIESTVDSLGGYNIDHDMVWKMFRNKNRKFVKA